MTDLLLVLVSLGLVAACGAFVAAEFALVTVDRSKVEKAAEEGDRRSRGVLAALVSLSTQLSAAQVGITVTNLLIGFLAEPAIAELIDGPLENAGVPSGAVTGIALAIALVLATAVTMVFGELVPKNLAITRPFGVSRSVQGFQRGFTRATGPMVRFLNGNANAILRRLGVEPQEELASARSAEELASLVRRSGEQGTLDSATALILQRWLAFRERNAADAMTPRTKVHALAADASALDVFATTRATGHSRFPVLDADGQEVVGIVHVKDAMAVPHDRRGEVAVAEIMGAPVLVPAVLELDNLLETLKRGGLQMAAVIDEWGNFDGIVTLEDLVEEIVGDVRDEHDLAETDAWLEADGTWLLSALLRPDEVARTAHVRIPEDEDYDTIAGLISDELQRIPRVGDAIELDTTDTDGAPLQVTLTVTRMDNLRVDRVRLRRRAVEPPDGDREDRR
ncbi:MAG: HlyC/CorC family transporter [Solirubrobacterales bacterium]|nr:HlyC/CorC family transporter [Solirubrobacterales bacterium]